MNIIKYLALLPSITFGLLKNSEISPWASLFIFSNKTIDFLINKYLIFILYIGFSVFYSLWYYLDNSMVENIPYETLRSISAYLNPIIVFSYLLSCNKNQYQQFTSIAIKIFIFYIFLALSQLAGFLEVLNSLSGFLGSRINFTAEGIGGARLLASEPSRAAVEFLFLFLIIFYFFRLKYTKLLSFLFYLLFVLFQVLVFRSVDGLVLSVFVGFIFFPFISTLLTIILLIAFTSFDFTLPLFDVRSLRFIAMINNAGFSLDSILTNLNNASGFRITSMQSSFNYGLNNIFGGGVGMWPITSLHAYDDGYFSANETAHFIAQSNGQFHATRPTSYIANIFLDFGIAGFTIFILSLFYSTRHFISQLNIQYFIIFLITLFFFSAVGNPVYWIVVALVLRNSSQRDNYL